MSIKLLCAWCNEEIGAAVANSNDPDEVSHGICSACYDRQMKEFSVSRTMLQ